MQGLKILVIFLGVLIFIALGGIVYAIVQKIDGPKAGESVHATFADSTLAVTAGTEIISLHPAEDRLYLRLRSAGEDRILVLDDRGRRIGLIRLVPDAGDGDASAAPDGANP